MRYQKVGRRFLIPPRRVRSGHIEGGSERRKEVSEGFEKAQRESHRTASKELRTGRRRPKTCGRLTKNGKAISNRTPAKANNWKPVAGQDKRNLLNTYERTSSDLLIVSPFPYCLKKKRPGLLSQIRFFKQWVCVSALPEGLASKPRSRIRRFQLPTATYSPNRGRYAILLTYSSQGIRKIMGSFCEVPWFNYTCRFTL